MILTKKLRLEQNLICFKEIHYARIDPGDSYDVIALKSGRESAAASS